MNEWTPMEAEIWHKGKVYEFETLAKEYGLTNNQVRDICDQAFDKFQSFDDKLKADLDKKQKQYVGVKREGGRINRNSWRDEEMAAIDDALDKGLTVKEACNFCRNGHRRPFHFE